MARKFRIYQRIKRLFERDVILQRTINEKGFTGKPQSKITEEYNIKAAILNQKTGYKLNSLALDNERQNTDLTMDIYFHEELEIEPKVKDLVLWNDKSQYVRKALATNLQLSKDEISMIINDNHLFVLPGLASNPAVPHQALLQVYKKLREQGSNGWDDFVMNPNCPKEIIGEIMDKSNDNVPFIDEHRVWLLNTMERQEEFRKAKAQGYPFPKGEYYPWGHADIWWRNDEVDIGMRNGGTP